MRTVTARVLLPGSTEGTADVRIQVLEASRADAPSTVVAETIRKRVDLAVEDVGLDFALQVSCVDERRHYIVVAHVDRNTSGHLSEGDLYSVASHPVLTFGHPDRVEVPVIPI